ncbi:MAG: cytochrome b N-terminal domain-containing protein [Gammaproteobacteria bacterium]|nr:cytochrome b N-terminal domain-containing protein [Gammaproteobacteria bacterium]
MLQRIGRSVIDTLGRLLAPAFELPLNPLRHLGSLTIFFLWIVLVSGIWLLIFFDTSVHGAYLSVEYLSHEQRYLGGVMRSLHRYASDAAIITLALHMLKEFSLDRYRDNRWFSWFTGVPLIWLLIPLGFTGYWLVWDSLAQYVALTSAELLDWLPFFTDSMARNFLSEASLSDRFFTLLAFLHLIGMPIILVFGIWLHVFRISRPAINPPRKLMVGTLLCMLVLSLIYPAYSQGPANLASVPESLGIDWYYLLVYPLVQLYSPGFVWGLLAGITVLLLAAPWLPPARRAAPAVVNLDNCNGCERCVDDCPFDAVSMAPRSDGKAYALEAVVDPELCISCGICVGACPTATPFRTRSALVPGIDLPERSAVELRASMHSVSQGLTDGPRVLVIACRGSAAAKRFKRTGTGILEVACMAQIPPSFLDYALSRNLADGVLLGGCSGGDCQYRLGALWTSQRIQRQRDPHLRQRVDNTRIALAWESPWSAYQDPSHLLDAFGRSVSDAPHEKAPTTPASPIRRRLIRPLALVASYGLLALVTGWLSNSPAYQLLNPGQAMIALSFSHAGQRLHECHTLTQDELNKLPPNMRALTDCPRERHPVQVELRVDGEVVYKDSLMPSGLWDDGESSIYKRVTVNAGKRRVFIGMRDSGRTEGFDIQQEVQMDLSERQNLLVELDDLTQRFLFR